MVDLWRWSVREVLLYIVVLSEVYQYICIYIYIYIYIWCRWCISPYTSINDPDTGELPTLGNSPVLLLSHLSWYTLLLVLATGRGGAAWWAGGLLPSSYPASREAVEAWKLPIICPFLHWSCLIKITVGLNGQLELKALSILHVCLVSLFVLKELILIYIYAHEEIFSKTR